MRLSLYCHTLFVSFVNLVFPLFICHDLTTTQLSSHFPFHNDLSWKKRLLNCLHTFTFTTKMYNIFSFFTKKCIISWNSISIQEPQSLMHMVVHQPPPPCPKTTGGGKKRQLNCLLTFTFTTTGVMGFLVIVAHCSSPDHSHGSKAGS